MTDRLRLVFAGTPEFASAHLATLLDWPGGDVVAVYTQPDRPAGRGKRLAPSPVKVLAEARGLPLHQPTSLKGAEAQAELAALAPDVLVVVAYGLILPAAVLAIPRLGCINVHGSILPRWRGAAPVQRAIEAGDAESGVTIMQMDVGLDTGPMLQVARCAIDSRETSASLFAKLEQLGPRALLETLAQLAAGQAVAEIQDDALSNYARKIDKAEAEIDWTQSAINIDRKVRAFYPDPIAFAVLRGERIRIHRAEPAAGVGIPGTILSVSPQQIVVACADGALAIQQLQLPGGKVLSVREVLNGRANGFAPGTRFDPVAPTGAHLHGA